jgi:ornithine cyclodeaminase
MIESGELTRDNLYAEIGEVTNGDKAGRADGDGRIVFWHRGFAISDIMLGAHILEAATSRNIGTLLNLFDEPDE